MEGAHWREERLLETRTSTQEESHSGDTAVACALHYCHIAAHSNVTAVKTTTIAASVVVTVTAVHLIITVL